MTYANQAAHFIKLLAPLSRVTAVDAMKYPLGRTWIWGRAGSALCGTAETYVTEQFCKHL